MSQREKDVEQVTNTQFLQSKIGQTIYKTVLKSSLHINIHLQSKGSVYLGIFLRLL